MTRDQWAELSRHQHARNPSCTRLDCCGCEGLDVCGRETEADRLRDLLKRLVAGCDVVIKFNAKLRDCRCATCEETYGPFREALEQARKETT